MPTKVIDLTRIAIFQKKEIRKTIYKNEWYFSVVDVIFALTDSINPRDYWFKMKIRVKSEDGAELSTNCRQLKLKSADGKLYLTDCSDTEGIFRIIQSIPSPKAEPFKRWLAKVGYERIQEVEDPELAQKRARAIYKAKGYPDSWIEKRMRSIAIREDLTEQWEIHGVKLQKEYAILTAEISQAAFGVTPSQHKKIKGLERQNLRDHMSDLELLFSMLGEASTTAITKTEHPKGFTENKKASRRGGKIAGDARVNLEKEIGKSIVKPRKSKKLK